MATKIKNTRSLSTTEDTLTWAFGTSVIQTPCGAKVTTLIEQSFS